ncbi:Uncharacterised protein [Salmonella enterica subsp. enterica serovar Typhi]|nr:Uncharacterised protein [Salmonella enterica subsp. enterica serovar Typhi]CWZ64749.1 Uncharacterised protein [Salmonella enterica subsp. enterica serovar Typhi]CXA35842.1 Uncharacterised protein [Salmonella enterica subsp. enterica serovar Typhi]
MDNVLLSNANFVIQELGDNRDVPGFVKLAALLPDEQRPGLRRARRTVREGLQRQNIVIHDLAQKTQRENFPGHADVSKNNAIIQKEKTAGKFHALPFMPHVFIVDVATKSCVVVVPRIEGIVI